MSMSSGQNKDLMNNLLLAGLALFQENTLANHAILLCGFGISGDFQLILHTISFSSSSRYQNEQSVT